MATLKCMTTAFTSRLGKQMRSGSLQKGTFRP